MKKDWKYVLYLSLAFGVFVAVTLLGPTQYDWTPTYAVEDKNPYGAYVLNELLPELFKGKSLTVSNQTVYEVRESLKQGENVLILTHSFRSGKEDAEVLLKHAEKGGSVFIGAESFYDKLADTLRLTTSDYLFTEGMYERRRDTSYLKFVNPRLGTRQSFVFRRDNIHNYFSRFDSTRTTIIAENDLHQPVTILLRWGKGNFILNCTPLAFTNIYLLKNNNTAFAATTFSYLPLRNLSWTEYYSVGRLEAGTPLRFILTHEPLAWAYYIALLSLLLFIAFEAKRKQRVVPIVRPLDNTSLEFVGTIGNLYFGQRDHRNIAEKKILFFFDQVRSRYSLNLNTSPEDFLSLLSKKSGKSEADVRTLFQLIATIRKQRSIKEEVLIELNTLLEKFF